MTVRAGRVVLHNVNEKGSRAPGLHEEKKKNITAQSIKIAIFLYSFICIPHVFVFCHFRISYIFFVSMSIKVYFLQILLLEVIFMNKKERKKKKELKLSPLVQSIVSDWEAGSDTDVLGSYTGNSTETVKPQQDADDL